MRACSEYEITIEKLLLFNHTYTETLIIYVCNDMYTECKKVKGLKRLRDFTLTKNANDKKETARLLKYYKDVPVWNLCADLERDGNGMIPVLLVHCHLSDFFEEFLKEREDRKKEKNNAKH